MASISSSRGSLKLKETTKRHSKYHKRGQSSTNNLAANAGLLKVIENDSSEALNQTVQLLEDKKLSSVNSDAQAVPAAEQLESYEEHP